MLQRSVSASNDGNQFLDFRHLYFLAHILLAPGDRTGRVNEEVATSFIVNFTRAFTSLDTKQRLLDVPFPNMPILVQHDIRFYSVSAGKQSDELPWVDCYREAGLVPVRTGEAHFFFVENRTSIIFIDTS